MYCHVGKVKVLPARPCNSVPTTAKGDNLIALTNLVSKNAPKTSGLIMFDNCVNAISKIPPYYLVYF